MLRRFLETLALGVLAAFLLGAWDIRLHHDLAAGMPWLAAERVRLLVPRGFGLGLALGGLSLSVSVLVRSDRPRFVRSGGIVGVALFAAASWFAAEPLVHAAWSRLFWGRMVLAVAVALAMAAAGGVTLGFWTLDVRRSVRRRPPVLVRARVVAASLTILAGLACVAVLPRWMERRAEGRPSVVVVSLDTLRADHLGFMGYGRPTSPLLDGLAVEGAVFEQAWSGSSWTLPSHASLFTGLLPYDHRVLHVGQRVRPELRLLAEGFRNAGYRTAAFTGGGYVSWGYGFDQGFEVFEDHDEMKEGGPARLAANARDWARRHREVPFLLFVHSYETHGPYTHGDFANRADRGRLPEGRSERPEGVVKDPTVEERRYIADLYDGDVLHADRVIGGLLRDLQADGLLDNAVVIVTSDHGEDLWDHDADDIPAHGHSLYEEIVHVPLLVWAPGRVPAGCRVGNPVSQLDLPRTLLDLAGVADLSAFPGRSLAPHLLACSEPDVLPMEAEGIRYGDERFSRRQGRVKVIVEPTPASESSRRWGSARSVEIYDLNGDPGERVDRASRATAEERDVVEEVLRRIQRTERGGTQGPARPLSEELEEQLRSLGYVR